MSRDRHWQLAITPLSPVHLGSGQDYEPTGYVIDDGALFEFDGLTALSALPESERAKLGKILDGAPTQVMLRQVQGFFYSNRDRLIAASRRVARINPSMEAFYRDRIGQVAQRETGGREVQNKLEIERTAYNPVNGAPILPGSGLKGAIRTALLDRQNAGNSLRQVEDRRRGGTRKENNLELQQRLFSYQAGKFELDPMRLVRLADAAPVAPDALATQVHFAVNRKKQPVTVGGRLVDSQAEQRGLYQLLECLPSFQAQAFRSQLSIQDTGGLESRHWPDSRLRFDLQAIVAACNQFYRPILEEEIRLLRERGFLDEGWGESLQRLLRGPAGDVLESNRAFLLRVGRHSGAESVTLNGVRDIKIIKGRDERPEWLPAAKTLWLAAEEPGQHQGLLPFGWLLIEPYQEGERPPELDLSGFAEDLVDWRQRMQARITRARADLSQAQEHEIQVQREREAAEREAAERAARLANLSAEAKKLEALRVVLARDRAAGNNQAGGELAGILAPLLKEAIANWPVAESRELADLADEIYGFIGWSSSKKRKERQELIAALRSKA